MAQVLGQVKNAALVYLSTLVFGNVITFLQVLGYGLSLVGFTAYSYVKARPQGDSDTKAEKDQGFLSSWMACLSMCIPSKPNTNGGAVAFQSKATQM
ncbi:hypothetical protein CYMTET_33869 [Cymbomonas tetramitiformis]|uniref:Sugar phosphate transporter domain-containing protein n=1 Tax=Cymbomonas tetramitiformis TaxID=36881 RepID=A0AAE0KQS0_9CHLO|nr:hypothetical protein CYMTET_33869 [Cymbomonas tetramitiformis]